MSTDHLAIWYDDSTSPSTPVGADGLNKYVQIGEECRLTSKGAWWRYMGGTSWRLVEHGVGVPPSSPVGRMTHLDGGWLLRTTWHDVRPLTQERDDPHDRKW